MPASKAQIAEIRGRLSKLNNKQLAVYLMNIAQTYMQAENSGLFISPKNGFEMGLAIHEYLKRTDEDFKKADEETFGKS